MTSRATWLRLLTACTLAWLAGCEQASYSSHSEPTGQSPLQTANASSESTTAAAETGAATAASDPSTDAPTPARSAESTPVTGDNEPAKAATTPEASPVEAAPATAKSGDAASNGTAAATKSDSATTKDLTFDDIKFDIEKDGAFERSMLTPEIEGLVGRTVRIRGYILPTFQQANIRSFVLVRDNLECCFGPGAALYDCIVVDMVPGQSTNFTTRPVAVEGTFSVRELLDFDGVVRAIYHMEGKAVK